MSSVLNYLKQAEQTVIFSLYQQKKFLIYERRQVPAHLFCKILSSNILIDWTSEKVQISMPFMIPMRTKYA